MEFEKESSQANNIYRALGESINDRIPIFDQYVYSKLDTTNLKVEYMLDLESISSDQEFRNHFSRLAVNWRASVIFSGRINRIGKELLEDVREEMEKL